MWKARPGGRFVHVKTYPICTWSGALGPKEVQGDHMAPEGFYSVDPDGMKPDSKYHLALNIGYPNALDRALGRSGAFIMVHGDCKSVGCFAMTNDKIEEIYAFVREALDGGQERVPVHVFPFRMTAANLTRHANHAAASTWGPLKEAYNEFCQVADCRRALRCAPSAMWSIPCGPQPTKPRAIPRAPVPSVPANSWRHSRASSPRNLKPILSWPMALKCARPTILPIGMRQSPKAAVAEAEKLEKNRKMRKEANSASPAGTNPVAPFLNQ